MRPLFTTTLLIISLYSNGQKYEWKVKKEIPVYACVLVAGAFDGLRDYANYHYNGNNQFVAPSLSWTNKYKDHNPALGRKFPGSTTWLVWTTDLNHMAKTGNNLFMCGAIALKVGSYEKKKWYYWVGEIVSYWLVNRLGFVITYNNIKIK